MHILIFEPRLSGHHPQYLRYILEAAVQVADKVSLVTTTKFYDLPEYQVHLSGACDNVDVLPIDDSDHMAGIKRDYHHFGLLNAQIAALKPDRVWVAYIDRIAQIAGVMRFFSRSWSSAHPQVKVTGLLFRGAAAYQWNTALVTLKDKLSLWAATKAPVERLYTVDNVLHDYLAQRNIGHCYLMPEPVESSQPFEQAGLPARLQLPEHQDAHYIVSLGGQNYRKGVDLLITAFLQSDAAEHDYLILAGMLNGDIRAQLDDNRDHRLAGNILVKDELLTIEQIQMYLEVSSYVAVPYPEHIGSSSFVIRASVARKPLIASNSGWIGWTTERYKLGFACNVKDIAELSATISKALKASRVGELPDADFDALAQYHTVENFKQTWMENS